MAMRLQLNLGKVVLLSTVAVVLLFGSANYFWIRMETREALGQELGKRGIQVAKALAIQSVDPVVLDDQLALRRLIDETVAVDEEISYVFVVGPGGKLAAHTFSQGFPVELLNANPLPAGKDFMVRRIVDPASPGQSLRDIAVPIADGYAGAVHIGIREDMLEAGVRRAERAVLSMVLSFMALGVLASLLFSRSVSRPLVSLTKATEGVELEKLKKGAPALQRGSDRRPRGLIVETEVDRLTVSFGEMMRRLSSAYERLEAAQKKLMLNERLSAIGSVAAGMAHELNNPIAGLKNCIRRLQRNPDDREQLARYLGVMEESTNKMYRVVEGLLDLARPRPPEVVDTPLASLIDRVGRLVGHKLEECGVALTIHLNPAVTTIRADPDQLEHILTNLVANACDSVAARKASDPSFEPSIQVLSSNSDGKIKLSVIDNGIGISTADLPRVFDAFFTTKRPGRGTGLGLAICQDMARLHGGELEVESRPGEGAHFRLSLPIEHPESGRMVNS